MYTYGVRILKLKISSAPFILKTEENPSHRAYFMRATSIDFNNLIPWQRNSEEGYGNSEGFPRKNKSKKPSQILNNELSRLIRGGAKSR